MFLSSLFGENTVCPHGLHNRKCNHIHLSKVKNAKADPEAKFCYLNLPHLVPEKILKLKIIGYKSTKMFLFHKMWNCSFKTLYNFLKSYQLSC